MKLTYEILKNELAERTHCEVYGIKQGQVFAESPKLYEDKMQIVTDFCYVAKSAPSKLAHFQSNVLFIICDSIQETVWERASCSLLCFKTAQSLRHVMNTLLDVFAKYRQWSDALLTTLHESGPIDALLKLSIPIFENPLFLIDSRFFRIAEASPGDPPDFSSPTGKVDETWIVRGKDELIGAIENKEPFFRHLTDDYPRLFINMIEKEYLLGNLSIQASNRPLREYDDYLLVHLATIVHTAMLRFASSDYSWQHRLEGMFSEIIAGGTVREDEFNQALSYFGYTQGDQFRCLALRIPTPSGKEFIRNFLRLLGPQNPALYIPTSGEIAAMVLNVSFAMRQNIEPISFIEGKVNALGFRVGVSDAYDDLLVSQQYFAQSCYALKCGEVAQVEKSVLLFSDYCLDYILENVSGDLKPSMLWNDGFRKLIVHDAKGRANYVETLRAYLYNNLNAHRAAAKLYISRNSLLSQLERIQSLIGEDLNDPSVRFRYELSLLLYDKWNDAQKRPL